MTAATVVVPTWNGAHRLERLLRSLAIQSVPHQVVVVDNGSTDGTREMLRGRFPAVEVITLPRNEGFSRAINVGARRAEGDALVLLNDDCVCSEGFVEALAGALDPASGVVMAASVLCNRHDPALIESAGMELDHTLLVWEHLHGEPISVLDRPVPEPVGPSAAAAAFDRAAFLGAGGFDEHLFAYWEDVDLVVKLRLDGGRCVLARGALGVHEHSATLGAGSREKNYLMGFGRGYILRKWSVLGPRRIPHVAVRELVICVGQAAIDGNAAGVRGRLDGYRAAKGAPKHPYPADVVLPFGGAGALRTLRRRLRRRAALRKRANAGGTRYRARDRPSTEEQLGQGVERI